MESEQEVCGRGGNRLLKSSVVLHSALLLVSPLQVATADMEGTRVEQVAFSLVERGRRVLNQVLALLYSSFLLSHQYCMNPQREFDKTATLIQSSNPV